MDFLFQDDGVDIIRRELMMPKAAVIREFLKPNTVTPYLKLAQVCFGDIEGDGVPGSDCQKRGPNVGLGNPDSETPGGGGFDFEFEDFEVNTSDNEGGTDEERQCAVGQIKDKKRNEAAKAIASDIAKKAAEDGRRGTDQPEYSATIATDSNGNAHRGEIAQG